MSEFSDALLTWYDENRRILPWREDPTPYHVLLSEIMLQQTRVDTVIPYFERFLGRFPTISALANAEEEEVLVYWQGLGYYSRARNLHKAAKYVVEHFDGQVPSDVDELLKLPGVGEYVSHAVAAIAFDHPFIAVDGNLLRVYARVNASPIDVGDVKAKRDCEAFYAARIDRPSRFNQALMDLGELVCLPHGTPRCESCPLAKMCKGKTDPLAYPLPKKKNAVKKQDITAIIVRDEQGRIAVRKRQGKGLLEGVYELPNYEGRASIKRIKETFPSLEEVKKRGESKHRFSHIEWSIHVYEAKGVIDGFVYSFEDEIKRRYSLPTAFAKLLNV